jgi:hypothetical protein
MKRILFTFLLLSVFTPGCTLYQIDSKDTSEEYYVPKTNITEVAYVEKVDKPFTQIAMVSVTTERRQTLEDVLPKLKQEAGMLGADAITDVHNEATAMWKAVKPQKLLANAYIRTTYSAKAIVWNK